MKKLFFSFILAVACLLPNVASAEVVRMTTDADYQIFALSANGQWAVGMQGDGTSDMFCFRWNLLSNEIELSPAPSYCGTSISNDGVYCGGYTITDEIGRKHIVPGYYDGEWHQLPTPEGMTVLDALDGSITPDGRTMAITLETAENRNMFPAVWRDGEFQYTLPAAQGGTSRVYCVSDDGQKFGGWTETTNRQTCYWLGQGDCTLFDNFAAMWAEAIHFSADGKHLLWYGGWDSMDYVPGVIPSIYGLYNLETKEKQKFPALTDVGESFSTHAITEDLTVIGEYGITPVLIKDGVTTPLNDWLVANYNISLDTLPELQTISDEGGPGGIYILRGQAISRDGKTIGIYHYGNDNLAHSTIIRLDVNFDNAAPVAVVAKQISGINAVRLSWKAPYGISPEKVSGFKVYRNGELIATVSGNEYCEGNLAAGDYTYEVSLLNAAGEESARVATQITIADPQPQAPCNVYARQLGYNGAMLEWTAPETNLLNKRYYNSGSATEGFGANQADLTMETGILFPADEMAMYSTAKISAVSFYPMSQQRNFTINLYTRAADGKLTKLLTKVLRNNALTIGQKNTIQLDEPLDIPAADLIVATSAQVVDQATSTSVFGMEYGYSTPGKSDLLRRVMTPEEDFASMKDMGAAVGIPMSVSWKIDLILTPEGAAADIDSVAYYEVAGNQVTANRQAMLDLPAGAQTLGVTAVYADGRRSPEANATVNIAPRTEEAPAIDVETVEIANDGDQFTASWQQPLDFDQTTMAYHNGKVSTIAVSAPKENNYNLVAGVKYPAARLRTYDGYQLTSVRFYPMSDATFTILINQGDEQIVEQEVDDYTLNQWNTVVLDEPVTILPNTAYTVYVDCYDVTPDGAPLAVERGTVVSGLSDLINYGGNVWNTLEEATAIPLSWLIDAQFNAPEGFAYPAPTYNFYINGVAANAEPLAEPSIKATATEGGVQPFAVGVTYPGAKEKMSGQRNFDFGQTGIEDITVLNANGRADVQTLQGITIMQDAKASDLKELPAGVYIIGGKKVQVR